ncbi:MAG TPA: ABC transporter permease, partial [Xanthobacteraceae bacterium]|nr:ABC transporter permease [Xanthobacteraceae bacterium]
MRREGSAFSGLGVVMLKELSDHLSSVRMVVMEWLVVLTAVGVVYTGIQQIREVTAEDPFLFLRLFTRAGEGLPSFVSLLSFLVPLVAIGIGFDLVNSEFNQRTLSRILSQPIYRDALLFGKFLAGLVTLGIMLIALWLMVIGLGILFLGLPPGAEEIARAVAMLAVTIVYAGVWLALAMLFSIMFRSAATAALVALGLWLFLTMIWPLLSPYIAAMFVSGSIASSTDLLDQLGMLQAFARLSPGALFGEIVGVLLDPTVRSTQQPLLASLGLMLLQPGSIPGAPLPLLQSLLIVWPQTVGMIATAILLFVIGYVIFQRQEVR